MVEIKAPLWVSSGTGGCPDPMSFSRALCFGCETPWTLSTWRRRTRRRKWRTPRNGSTKSCDTVPGWCKAGGKAQTPCDPLVWTSTASAGMLLSTDRNWGSPVAPRAKHEAVPRLIEKSWSHSRNFRKPSTGCSVEQPVLAPTSPLLSHLFSATSNASRNIPFC